MTTPTDSTPDSPSFGDRMYSATLAFVRALVRLVLILLVAFLIGAAIYLGVPRLYQQYLQPVQDNTAAIQDLNARQQQDAQAIRERLGSLQERLDSLEVQGDQDKQTIATLQSEIAALESELESVGSTVAAQEEGLSAISLRMDDFDQSLDDLDVSIESLESGLRSTLADLSEELGENREEIAMLEKTFSDAENPLNSLRRELQLVRAMELITRSRLFLAQDNQGLAAEDLERARDLLVALSERVPEYQQEALSAMVERLDMAVENLPDQVAQAESDLEVAWGLLVEGLPEAPETEETLISGTPEATPGPDAAATPTPTPTSDS